MKTFEEIYQLVNRVSDSDAAFNKEECQVLYDLVKYLPKIALVVEIGLQFGRSATVLAALGKQQGYTFIGIDNWQEDVSKDAKRNIEEVIIKELGFPIQLINKDSKDAWEDLPVGRRIDLIHIDGDHEYDAVLTDCLIYLPFVRHGGYACFDDYGEDSLPGVFKAVTEYMGKYGEEWVFYGRFGNKLGVFKKL